MPTHINSIIDRNNRFVVTTHTRPDGDAIGSQLALGLMLSKLGKEVLLISADPPARNLDWLPESGRVQIYDGSIAQREFIASADLIVVVDTNVEDRLGSLGEPVRHSGAEKMLIDHHPDGENWFDHRYVRESASSTGELIFELITDRGLHLIDHDLATALYVAIMTDTGSFRYSNVSATVHRIIADLIEHGKLDPELIHRKLYDSRTMAGLRLLSAALATVSLRFDDRLGLMTITGRMLDETGADRDDTEGLVNYLLTIDSVEVALLFFEIEAGTKVSFRAQGDAEVHRWAQSFGGGGHRKAAGAFLKEPADSAVKKVLAVAGKYLGDDADRGEADALSPEDATYLNSLLAMKDKDSS